VGLVTRRHSGVSGSVADGVDWSRFTVVLLKPDCVRRGLVGEVLSRLVEYVELLTVESVIVADWQVFVHYWDLLVDRDWFDIDIPECLRSAYVGREVAVALGRGHDDTTAADVRSLLGHFDPTVAALGTIRGDLGEDSHQRARDERRLVENLIHTSDDPVATCRDFGVWFGANRAELLNQPMHKPNGEYGGTST
jgi:nucleoside diphosphate kinase